MDGRLVAGEGSGVRTGCGAGAGAGAAPGGCIAGSGCSTGGTTMGAAFPCGHMPFAGLTGYCVVSFVIAGGAASDGLTTTGGSAIGAIAGGMLVSAWTWEATD